jgi:hypothetical protein
VAISLLSILESVTNYDFSKFVIPHVLSGLPAGQAGNPLILDSGSAFGRPE